jgi:hypothetical protein
MFHKQLERILVLGIIVALNAIISNPGLSQTQVNSNKWVVSSIETSDKIDMGCAPKSNQSRILSSPNPNDIHPEWKGESYIGMSWSLIAKEIINNDTGIYLKGDLYSPRGGLINENIFVIENEWDCNSN